MDLIISGFKVFLGAQMSVPFRGVWDWVTGGMWIPTFRWNLQGIVGCFKKQQQKMWDFISGRSKYV